MYTKRKISLDFEDLNALIYFRWSNWSGNRVNSFHFLKLFLQEPKKTRHL